MSTFSFTVRARRMVMAAGVGAAMLASMSGAAGQVRQGAAPDSPVPPNAQQAGAPVDPQSLSCTDLKSQMKAAGEMNLLAGPRAGWSDTFYGPSVPRCQFYQMPQFAYVKARDGLCGVGFICVDKMSID